MEDKLKTLISLAFPSMMAPKKKRIDIGRTDTDNMSEAEYNQWFQGQGRADKSYPVASVVGPLKGANLLRKWLLGRTVKPKPTTAPLTLSGPPDLPRLTHNPDPDDTLTFFRHLADGYANMDEGTDWEDDRLRLFFDDDVEFGIDGDETPDDYDGGDFDAPLNAYERGLERRNRFRNPYDYSSGSGEFPPGEFPESRFVPSDDQGRLIYRPESGLFEDGRGVFYMEGPPTNIGEFTPWGNMSEPRQHPDLVEPSTGMQPSVDGFRYDTTGVDWIDDETPTLWDRLEENYRRKDRYDPLSYSKIPKEDDIAEGFFEDLLQGHIPTIGQDPAYPQPEGYRSLLSELATGGKVYEDYTAEEKNSMKRELKERSRVGESVYEGDMNDQPAMTKWLEKNPLQMTVHTIKDTWGAGNPEDMVSMLYFGGEDRPVWAADHYRSESGDLSDGRLKEPQAFVRWDITPQGNVFKVKEAQIDMRYEKGKATPPVMKESMRKLAQQTIIDWATNSTSDILTIPTGEESFEKNHGKLSDFGDDAFFITLEGDDKFESAMKESRSLEPDPILEQHRPAGEIGFPNRPQTSIEKLRELRAKYWGKVRHYNKYKKAVMQILKESRADIKDVTPDGSERPFFKIKNPDEVRQRVEDEPFSMSMVLKRIADRQVA